MSERNASGSRPKGLLRPTQAELESGRAAARSNTGTCVPVFFRIFPRINRSHVTLTGTLHQTGVYRPAIERGGRENGQNLDHWLQMWQELHEDQDVEPKTSQTDP